MKNGSRPVRPRRIEHWGIVGAWVTLLASSLVIVGWMADVPRLRAPVDPGRPMKANVALAFVLLSAAVLGLRAWPHRRASRVFAGLAGAVTMVGMAVTLLQDIIGGSLGIDQVLVLDVVSKGPGSPGRGAPQATLGLALLALVLAVHGFRGTRRTERFLLLALAVPAVAGVLALIGHVVGTPLLFSIGGRYPAPVETAIALIACSLAVAGVAVRGPTLFDSDLAGGVMFRRSLAMMIGIPLVAGVAHSRLAKVGVLGSVDPDWAIAIGAVGVALWWLWRTSNAIDRYETTKRASEDRFRLAFDNSSAGKVLVDLRVTPPSIIAANPAVERMLAVEPGSLVGKDPTTFVHPEDREGGRSVARRAVEGEIASVEFETRWRRADGDWVPMRVSGGVARDDDGPQFMLATFADLSEEQALASRRAKELAIMEGVLENAPVAIYIVDQNGRFLVANRDLHRIAGLEDRVLIGRTWHEVPSLVEVAEEFERGDRDVMVSTEAMRFEQRLETQDGTRDLIIVRFPLSDPSGSVFAVGGIAADVTALKEAERDAVLARQETLVRLARAVELRDEETGGHIKRMAEFCRIIAGELGVPDARCDLIRDAALMHDAGKVGIPDDVLMKEGPFSDYDRKVMEKHPVVGYEILAGSGSELLELAATIALSHHERFDGAGYPQGLFGEAIPLESRIASAADVFDALTSDRVYRKAFSIDEAVRILKQEQGAQLDPDVVDALIRRLPEILEVKRRIDDEEEGAETGRYGKSLPAVDEPKPRVRGVGAPAAATIDLSAVAKSMLDTSDTMVVLTDPAGTILYVNPAFTEVTGYSFDEAVGGRPSLLRSGVQGDAFYKRLWATIVEGRAWHGEIVNRRKDGSLYTDEMTIVPLGMETGRPTHFLAIKRDISSRIQALTSSSPIGLAHADPEGGLLYVNARTEALFGAPFPDLIGRGWLDRLAPSDRDSVLHDLESAYRSRGQAEHSTIALPDGRVASVRIAALTTPQGDRLGLVVSFEDVTAEIKARDALIERERFTRGILDAMRDPTAVVDANGAIIAVNAAWDRFSELNGGSNEACGVGADYLGVCTRALESGCEDAGAVRAGLEAILGGRQDFFEFEYPCPSPTEDRWYLQRITPLEGFDAAVLAHIDITWRKQAERRLSFVANHDPLTGLLNRAALEEHLAAALPAGRQSEDGVALIFIDLDGFKAVNDTFGHAMGDAVLARAGDRILHEVRTGDVVARMGGDEFVVVLASTEARLHASSIAERIEHSLAQPFQAAGKIATIGASVGVAFARAADTPQSLLERADTRMYLAKVEHHGRAAAAETTAMPADERLPA